MHPIPPTYGRFVLWTAIQAGISAFLLVVCWVGLLASMIGGFVPSLEELQAVGTYYLAVLAYGVVMFFMIFIQNERWNELYRQPVELKHRPVPRPIVQTFQAMAHNSRTLTVGERSLLPPTIEHYALLHESLRRNDWRITRKAITVKLGDNPGVPAFTSLSERYSDIVSHWEDMGWVTDGELNAKGQQHFAEYGHVRGQLPHPI